MMKSYIYTNNGRVRIIFIAEDGRRYTKSYPRFVMELYLKRRLKSYEDVHHIDGNPLNNYVKNLEIRIHGEHQKEHSQKYFDKEAVCEMCNTKFIWTGIRQRMYYIDLRRGKDRIITCSRSCSNKYGRLKHLGSI